MTIEEFNNKNFAPLDIVHVIMKDGHVRREFLQQGKAHDGHPAIRTSNKKIIPYQSAEILVLGDFLRGTGGIKLVDIRDVTLVARLS